MGTRLNLVFGGVLVLVLTIGGTQKKTSSGAPIGSTGAPGENSCAKSGCHDDPGNLNSGDGLLSMHIVNAPEQYEPGHIYTIAVLLEEQDVVRFGFAMSALNAENQAAGTFMITDSLRNQVMKGAGPFEGREYMTYRYAGTSAYAPGLGKWIFRWKAPAVVKGPVRFYLAAVSANNDGTDGGDQVYTDSFELHASPSTVNHPSESAMGIYPNPVKDHFSVKYINRKSGETVIKLLDTRGQKLYTLWKGHQESGEQYIHLARPALPPGLYVLKVESGEGLHSQKISFE